MANPTVRLNPHTYLVLKELSAKSGEPMLTILDRAVESESRRLFFEEANASYAKLRENTQAWAEYKSELQEWDATLRDGLPED